MPIAFLGTHRFLLTLDGEARNIVRGELEQQLELARSLLPLLASLNFIQVVKCPQCE